MVKMLYYFMGFKILQLFVSFAHLIEYLVEFCIRFVEQYWRKVLLCDIIIEIACNTFGYCISDIKPLTHHSYVKL